MLGGVIVHVAPIGHAFVKVVSFGLHRSFCETCGRITGHLRALAVRAAHFLATSAVTADALPFMHPTAMQTNPTSALSNFTRANMGYPKAKHRGLTIAGLTVSVACIATKSAASCPSWVIRGRGPRGHAPLDVRFRSESGRDSADRLK